MSTADQYLTHLAQTLESDVAAAAAGFAGVGDSTRAARVLERLAQAEVVATAASILDAVSAHYAENGGEVVLEQFRTAVRQRVYSFTGRGTDALAQAVRDVQRDAWVRIAQTAGA